MVAGYLLSVATDAETMHAAQSLLNKRSQMSSLHDENLMIYIWLHS